MKYIVMCYYDTEKFASLSPEQMAEIGPNCAPFDQALRATGKVLWVASLADPEEWKSIRPVQDKPQVSAGPMVNIKQQIGAVFLVEADSLEEATLVASNHPAANYGEHIGFAVEVRACNSYD